MALSIDPIEEHHQWAPDIGEVTSTALNFPIVADPDRRVAELYDMIHPGRRHLHRSVRVHRRP
ncbi:MAG: redoxin domain-containing protein [Ilumatobacteraceae bacterium]